MHDVITRLKLRLRPYRRGLAAWRAARAHNATVDGAPLWFSPELPAPQTGIFSVAEALGRPIRKGIATHGPTFAWADRTEVGVVDPRLQEVGAINAACVDISKSTVDRVHGEVFGRSLAVDPTTHVGPMVEKSEANATHDGRVVDGPLAAAEPDRVYQRLIDATDGDEVIDLRVAVVGGTLPIVNEKRRPIATRFSNDNRRVIPLVVDDVFTAEEQEQLLALAAGLGMDFGEFDVLRDRHDGLIWVVDANKTPYLRPTGLDPADRETIVATLAAAVERELLGGRR